MNIDKNVIRENYIKLNKNLGIEENEEKRFNQFIDEVCDPSKDTIVRLNKRETLMLRMKLGVYTGGKMQTYKEIANHFELSSERVGEILHSVYGKINYWRIKKELPQATNTRMSSFSISNIEDLQISELELGTRISNLLFRRGINTVSDLLGYSILEFKYMGFGDTFFKKLIDVIHAKGLKFIEELTDDEKRTIISNSTKSQINESSLSWLSFLDESYLKKQINNRKFKIECLKLNPNIDNKILEEAFKLGIKLRPIMCKKDIETMSDEEKNAIEIQYFNLSTRAFNSLWRAGKYTVGDVVQLTRKELLRIRNLGEESATEIIDLIHKLGLETLDEKLKTQLNEAIERQTQLISRYKELQAAKELLEMESAKLDDEIEKLTKDIKDIKKVL